MSRSARPTKRSPLTTDSLRELALAYVGRFATTRMRLISYLNRKLKERGWEEDGTADSDGGSGPDVEALADRFVELGYIDDAAFARMKASSMHRRGLGVRRVAEGLRACGVRGDDGAEALDHARDEVAEAARTFARRKRFGPYATKLVDAALQQKQIASFLRAGHDLQTARRWVECAPGQFPEGETPEGE